MNLFQITPAGACMDALREAAKASVRAETAAARHAEAEPAEALEPVADDAAPVPMRVRRFRLAGIWSALRPVRAVS